MKKSILFVDDQDEILLLLKRMFQEEDYNLYFANGGPQAIELLKHNSIDILVTDLRMPGMSGLEVLKIVKTQYPEIVRIVLSGFSQIPSIIEAINSGDIFKYITKPWKVDEDAKKIIKEASDYSDYLKSKNTSASDNFNIKKEDFLQLLRFLPNPYIFIENNDEAYSENIRKLEENNIEKEILIGDSYKLLILRK
ncbi:response regulator [Clostridium manihotivorum]|uniref:Stage 0 sporulation protein A homolog n=1 Tax=Clostridium manihotivorum TaxID=2320868 RepID=A0A410DV57_9CLOT|nr:response regulator [Clostridium manihotivorum]QAA32940.1 response regulator [Clostridium manihotivorum]